MITYRDRTWCSEKCGNAACVRNYTKQEHLINEGGVNLPLSVGNMKTQSCGYSKPKGDLKC